MFEAFRCEECVHGVYMGDIYECSLRCDDEQECERNYEEDE